MFSIGAFARLAQVSVRTLHHYDELGPLRPAQADPRTGYRSYSSEQCFRLNRILAPRDLGLPLIEIRRVVDEQVSLAELRGMLRLRQAEASERVSAEAERLARVESRLRHIELEDTMSNYDIVVKSLDAQHVAVVAENVDSFGDSLDPVLGRLYGELHGELSRVGASPAGPDLALYDDSGDETTPIKAMAAVPIADTERLTSGRAELLEVPPVPRAASTIHRGSMSRVAEGYQALIQWADETGEQIDGYGREVYLDCNGDPDTWVTELQFVLEPRS